MFQGAGRGEFKEMGKWVPTTVAFHRYFHTPQVPVPYPHWEGERKYRNVRLILPSGQQVQNVYWMQCEDHGGYCIQDFSRGSQTCVLAPSPPLSQSKPDEEKENFSCSRVGQEGKQRLCVGNCHQPVNPDRVYTNGPSQKPQLVGKTLNLLHCKVEPPTTVLV